MTEEEQTCLGDPTKVHARKEALVELLVSLPTLPETWPARTVSGALTRALDAYERVMQGASSP